MLYNTKMILCVYIYIIHMSYICTIMYQYVICNSLLKLIVTWNRSVEWTKSKTTTGGELSKSKQWTGCVQSPHTNGKNVNYTRTPLRRRTLWATPLEKNAEENKQIHGDTTFRWILFGGYFFCSVLLAPYQGLAPVLQSSYLKNAYFTPTVATHLLILWQRVGDGIPLRIPRQVARSITRK